jgi:hypothetical protein
MTDEYIMTAPEGRVSPEWPRALHNEALQNPEERAGYDLALICRSCGNRWLAATGADGEFVPGFWWCPRGCDR